MTKSLTILPLALPLWLCACTSTGAGDLLQAVVWVQTAAEREALCCSTFYTATEAMRTHTARPGQKPFAVIVDVDETMLDNAPYQASLVRDGSGFARESWQRWVESRAAAAIPGAVEFATACRDRHVQVFYVTNRDQDLEAATRDNLQRCGFLLDAPGDLDIVLCRGEADGKADKAGRRAAVAATHEVVVVVGDDLGDFCTPASSVPQRRLQVQTEASQWGRHWFVLPNPMYGSWDGAVTAGATDVTAARRAAMSPAR